VFQFQVQRTVKSKKKVAKWLKPVANGPVKMLQNLVEGGPRLKYVRGSAFVRTAAWLVHTTSEK
jgi:hypothetical protein